MSRPSLIPLAIIPVLAFLGCSHPDEAALPLRAPGVSSPIVTGLRITGIDGLALGIWGRPSDSPSSDGGGGTLPTHVGMSTPWPNPCDGSCVIRVSLPRTSVVSIWIVRARWVGDRSTDEADIAGGTLFVPQMIAVSELIRNQSLPSGQYELTWNGTTTAGNPVPAGFYRVYFKTGDTLLFKDIFLYRSWADLPADLHSIVQQRDRFHPLPNHH